MKTESENARAAMTRIIEEQAPRPDWHDHEFYTLEHENGESFKRYFRASSLHLETDGGIKLNIVPRERGEVTIYFDEGREAQKRDLETILTPGATNCVRLRLAKVESS
jgi:hypothetical protein